MLKTTFFFNQNTFFKSGSIILRLFPIYRLNYFYLCISTTRLKLESVIQILVDKERPAFSVVMMFILLAKKCSMNIFNYKDWLNKFKLFDILHFYSTLLFFTKISKYLTLIVSHPLLVTKTGELSFLLFKIKGMGKF